MFWLLETTACSAEPQRRLIVRATELMGRPAWIEATRETYGERDSVGTQLPTTT